MRVYYDLHLHSCLSPCGSNDMTPYNLVNLAAIHELNVIALTDHNSSLNCPAALNSAKQAGIVCIPGMELNTSEEIHVVCLFETLEGALEFDAYVARHLPTISNKPDIFGEQLVMDAHDHMIRSVEPLLITATDISVMQAVSLTEKYGGIAFPAHIDKPAYSILASLGDIPPECNFTAVEITPHTDVSTLIEKHGLLRNIPLLKNSDAHYLEHMAEPGAWLELPEISAGAVLAALKNGDCSWGR